MKWDELVAAGRRVPAKEQWDLLAGMLTHPGGAVLAALLDQWIDNYATEWSRQEFCGRPEVREHAAGSAWALREMRWKLQEALRMAGKR